MAQSPNFNIHIKYTLTTISLPYKFHRILYLYSLLKYIKLKLKFILIFQQHY